MVRTTVTTLPHLPLSAVAGVQMGYSFRSRLESVPAGSVTVVQMKDLGEDNLLHLHSAMKVALPVAKEHHFLRAGDLLFRSRGRSNEAALVQDDVAHAVVSAPILLVRPRRVLPEYLLWFINSPTTQAQFRVQAVGTSVPMISAEALRALPVPIPSESVQRQIAAVARLSNHERSLTTKIAELRQRLTDHMLLQCAHQTRKANR